MVNIILFGPPGSGKGTQAINIINKYKMAHISTGDLLRSEVDHKTKLGIEAKAYMDKGKLVPDEIVIGMIGSKIDQKMQNGTKGFIFDGFPRTVAQAEALDEMLNSKNTGIVKVLAVQVAEDELIQRILNRGKTSGRIDDQEISTIKKRIEEYHVKTTPVASYYDKENKLIIVDGMGNIEETFEKVANEIDKLL